VFVSVLEPGLVHVAVAVLGSVVMSVGVLVLDVLVFMRGVRVRVSDSAVPVFVSVRRVVGVFGHLRSSPLGEKHCSAWV
jgi:hypothetical protein